MAPGMSIMVCIRSAVSSLVLTSSLLRVATSEQACEDSRGWVDSSGYNCGDYSLRQWCSADGGSGPRWDLSWGELGSFAVSGVDAAAACCDCGGGARGATATPHVTDHPLASARTCEDYADWIDSEEYPCSAYETYDWCTGIGGFGSGWNLSGWGTFDNYAVNHMPATSACCACGGGTDPMGRPEEEELGEFDDCVDHPRGWMDSLNRSCLDYRASELCTESGLPGSGWRESGGFQAFAAHGIDASQACCLCGGGQHATAASTTGLPATEPATSAASATLAEGTDASISSQASTTTPELVVGPLTTMEAENSTVLARRSQEVTTTGPCFDVEGWVDTDAEGCAEYANLNYCTPTGGYGSAWQDDWGDFAKYARDGYDATTACCACGGGFATAMTTVTVHFGTTAEGCTDIADWKDNTEFGCDDYVNQQWCIPSGDHYGPSWEDTWGSFDLYLNDGFTAVTACCGCGRVGDETALQTTTLTAGPTAPGCVDIPDWEDRDSEGCQLYISMGWCLSSGETGPGWSILWGTFADYANEGHDASTACCGCGKDKQGTSAGSTTTGAAVAGTTASGCEDQAGWRDSQYLPCDAYVTAKWCTSDGKPGSGWKAEWGTLADFATQGLDATEACCGCGGHGGHAGFVPLTTPSPGDCTDRPPNWADATSEGCEAYVALQWCSSDGGKGSGWSDDWGTIADYADENSIDALSACCGCGGGDRGGASTVIASTTQRSQNTPSTTGEQSENPRKTKRGCECLKVWTDASFTCENYCCNPDNDPAGEWCLVPSTQEDCQLERWGYCAPLTGPSGTCVDKDDSWEDSTGDSCEEYATAKYCENGKIGSGWNEQWGKIADYAVNGKDASEMCCICGGGNPSGEVPKGEQHCFNYPVLWQDSKLQTCSTYRRSNFCTKEGKPGDGWDNAKSPGDGFGKDEAGISADVACCACGGGGVCVDDLSWVDSHERSCAIYADLDWCSELTPDGTGHGWKPEWGGFEKFANNGHSAKDACCLCGGGNRQVKEQFLHADVTKDGQWHILSGDCTISQADGCVQSPNYPGAYPQNSACVIAAPTTNGPSIKVEAFATEKFYDVLVVNFVKYSDDKGPDGIVPRGEMLWRSDASDDDGEKTGFRICPQGGGSPAPAPGGSNESPEDPQPAGGWVVAVALVMLGMVLAVGACWWARSKMQDQSSAGGAQPTQRYGRTYDNL
mmetsp:Transcript_50092/g.119180  ORF Transcript_50092/g.119180 Transcript_50092/m.119180 type:complete len:1195 (-) Transcript_50092:93-3677(-)